MKVFTKECRKAVFCKQQCVRIALHKCEQTDRQVFPDLFKKHCREKSQSSQLDICLTYWTSFFFSTAFSDLVFHKHCGTKRGTRANISLNQEFDTAESKVKLPNSQQTSTWLSKALLGWPLLQLTNKKLNSTPSELKTQPLDDEPGPRHWGYASSSGGQTLSDSFYCQRAPCCKLQRVETVRTVNINACSKVYDISCPDILEELINHVILGILCQVVLRLSTPELLSKVCYVGKTISNHFLKNKLLFVHICTTRFKMNSQVFADLMQFINFSWPVWGNVEESSRYFHVFSLKNTHCYINKTEHLSRTYSYVTFQGFWRKRTERKWIPAATGSKKTSKWALGVENKEGGAREWIKKVEM